MQEGKDTVKDGNHHYGEDLITPVLPSIKMLAGYHFRTVFILSDK